MATYAELIAEFPLRPIRTDRQLDRASNLAFRLAAERRLSREAADYLEVLSQLIETYEAERHPIEPDQAPRELLQFLIEESGSTLSQVAAQTGIKVSTLSEITRGKRELNVQHIRRLAARFRVEPGLFIAAGTPAGAR